MVILVWSLLCFSSVGANDITYSVFGKYLPGIPAAFGDFNSDELTDLFTIKSDGRGSSLEILLGSDSEPLLRQDENLTCTFKNYKITSVVPGDFDNDVMMDVLVTASPIKDDGLTYVYVHWGSLKSIECANESKPLIKMRNQPLAMDYNKDMIIDLFGLDEKNKRAFWIFNKNRSIDIHQEYLEKNLTKPFRMHHSNAFIDLNSDYDADLYITYDKEAEYWHRIPGSCNFSLNETVLFEAEKDAVIGQTTFLDMHSTGELSQLVPQCTKTPSGCTDSKICVFQSYNSKPHWLCLPVDFTDPNKKRWNFAYDNTAEYFLNVITLRAGDFNMDGYPDLLATLSPEGNENIKQTFLLLNDKCDNCNSFKRTFSIHWNALSSNNNSTILGVFYDFFQDGVLDIIFVQQNTLKVTAFRNSLDYDANFLKAMVISSVQQNYEARPESPLGKKYRIFGTNLPGPTISYQTENTKGDPQKASSAQLPQSAYFSLILPYTIFGLDRSPNFIDSLTVHFFGEKRSWYQLIPNSQIIVIPYPLKNPSSWRTQLFVTPSKIILKSVFALLGTCLLITAIIAVLYWKERKEDKKEKLQQAHRFHFDAM